MNSPSECLLKLTKEHQTYLDSQDGSTTGNCYICNWPITNKELCGEYKTGLVCIDCIDSTVFVV